MHVVKLVRVAGKEVWINSKNIAYYSRITTRNQYDGGTKIILVDGKEINVVESPNLVTELLGADDKLEKKE